MAGVPQQQLHAVVAALERTGGELKGQPLQ